MYDLTGTKKDGRLPVLVSGIEDSQLLAIAKISVATGVAQVINFFEII